MPVFRGLKPNLPPCILGHVGSPASVLFKADPDWSVLLLRVSRSENSGVAPSSRAVATVSAYLAEQLLCEGEELCFEEARALRYFRRQETEAREKSETLWRTED